MKQYLFVGLILLGCNSNSSKEDNSDDLHSLKLIRDAHVTAVNSQNVDLLLRDMSEEIVYLGPGLDPIIGKESLRNFIKPIYEVVSPTIDMDPKSVKIYDKIAIEWGTIKGTIRQQGIDSVQPFSNKYLLVYEKTSDGSWKITRDIYNE